MRVSGASAPPSPNATSDPFAPDPTIWPDAPGWLFPAVMIALVVAVVAVIVLVVMWRKSVVYAREQQAAKGPTEWIDLSKLDKKGHWEDDGPVLDDGAGSDDRPS